MKSSLGFRDQGYSYMTEGFMEENNISSSHKCTECVAQISQLMTITAKCRGIQGLEHRDCYSIWAYTDTKAGYGTTENQIWQLIFEVEPAWVLEHMGMYNWVKDMFQNFQRGSQNTSWLCHAWNMSHLTQSTLAACCIVTDFVKFWSGPS